MISKGDNIKGYIVEQQLGGGGFGEVYLVYDASDPTRKYAMKIIKSGLTDNIKIREGFINEMLNMARLSQHPNILGIMNSILFKDDEGERVGMVTEYLEGVSLGLYIHRLGKLPFQKAVPLFLQVLDAICYAHKRGVIHRDIKPSNVMVLPQKTMEYRGYTTHPVKVLDFGLSKALEGASATESMSGATLAYAAPERLKKGAQIDQRTDVYSLGVTLFEMLTGHSPFIIRSLADALDCIMTSPPPSLLDHDPACLPELDAVIRKAMAKEPSERYSGCDEMAKDIMAILAGGAEARSGIHTECNDLEVRQTSAPAALSGPEAEPLHKRGDLGAPSRETLPAGASETAEAATGATAVPIPPERAPWDASELEGLPPSKTGSRESRRKQTRFVAGSIAIGAILVAAAFWLFTGDRMQSQAPEQPTDAAVQTEAGKETGRGASAKLPSGAVDTGRTSGVPAKTMLTWQRTFGGSGNDEATCIRETADGGYVAAGRTSSTGKGKNDVWVIRMDQNGKELWNKTYGGAGSDAADFIEQTSDGGYILTGQTDSFGKGKGDAWVMRLDQGGNMLWNKTFGGASTDEGMAVHQVEDGGYILAGYTFSEGKGMSDAWVVRLDRDGKEIWDKTFGGPSYDGATSVQATPDGGYVLVGSTFSFGKGMSDALVIRLDKGGKELWRKTFGADGNDRAMAVLRTTEGGFIFAGQTQAAAGQNEDLWVVKLDSEGNEAWSKTFGGKSEDRATDIQAVGNEGWIVAGYTKSIGKGEGDAWLLRLDPEGNKLWDKTFGGRSRDNAAFCQPTGDGGYILAGSTASFGKGKTDAWIIKLDAEGNLEPPDARPSETDRGAR